MPTIRSIALSCLVVLFVPAAYPDNLHPFQFSVSSYVGVLGDSYCCNPYDDNDLPEYYSSSMGTGTLSNIDGSGGSDEIPGFSRQLCPQCNIVSATATFTPDEAGVFNSHAESNLSPIYGLPSPNTPPTIGNAQVTGFFPDQTWWAYWDWTTGDGANSSDSLLKFHGNHIEIGDFALLGSMGFTVDVLDPGSNWEGWIGANGTADLPYTVTLEGDYAVTPEPGTLYLLGSGLAALAGLLRKRFRAA
jgi:hypothetical protein